MVIQSHPGRVELISSSPCLTSTTFIYVAANVVPFRFLPRASSPQNIGTPVSCETIEVCKGRAEMSFAKYETAPPLISTSPLMSPKKLLLRAKRPQQGELPSAIHVTLDSGLP